MPTATSLALLAGLLVLGSLFGGRYEAAAAAQSRPLAPAFEVDPMWPRRLPHRWLLGAVAGVAVDGKSHIWIVHRPSTLQPNETRSIWRAAPPVLEFDPDGHVVSS